ncbi:MAG: class F sortase [Nocardioidaceae bacterium]|nr:class F sortase [Nocardioidaceae bacterium]
MTFRRRSTALALAMLVGVVALIAGWVLWSQQGAVPGEDSAAAASSAGPNAGPNAGSAGPAGRSPSRTACSNGARRGFEPASLSIVGIARDRPVIGVPRDTAGVPGVLPVRQKRDFAWDLGGVEPGSRRGQVLINTHTWPDGSALGNRLLTHLGKGDRLLVRGSGQHLCYRVTDKVEVALADGYPGYGRTDGPPVLVIVVCSGHRLGPGEWTHRTLWFAEPVA